MAVVRKGIEEFGYNQLIAVDPEGVIVAGHTRYLALQSMGITEPVKVLLLDLSPDLAKAYRIADNKASEFSTWNDDLAAELRELPDLDLMQAFFTEDLGKLLELPEPTTSGGSVTEAQVEEARGKLENKPTEEKPQMVACPECGHVFGVRP